MKKKLKLFNAQGRHVQTLTFTKRAKDHWLCTDFERDKYMSIQMHKPMSHIKNDLIKQKYTWEWVKN